MKKTLLLAGVAGIFAFNAQAMSWNINEYRPYIGADYSFFKEKILPFRKSQYRYATVSKLGFGIFISAVRRS